MKKKWCAWMALFCFAFGTFASIYVGAWMMFVKPIGQLLAAYTAQKLTISMLVKKILIMILAPTAGGTVFTVGYIGYNHFRGTEDPDWEEIERKYQNYDS